MRNKFIKNIISIFVFVLFFASCNKKIYYNDSAVKYIIMYTSYPYTAKSNTIKYKGVIVNNQNKMFLANMSNTNKIDIIKEINFDYNTIYNLQINIDSLNKNKIAIDNKGTVESIQISDCYFEEIIIYNKKKLFKYTSYCTDRLQDFVYTTDRQKFIDLRNNILNYYPVESRIKKNR